MISSFRKGLKIGKRPWRKTIISILIISIILMSLNFVFAATFGTTSSFSGGTSSFSGIRVYGDSVNAQYNNPGFLSSAGFTSPGVYWSNYEKQDCFDRADFIMQIAPGGCSPAVVRSDLLEEQDVPVFCKVMAIQVNPLIDVTKIRSLRFTGKYPKGITSVSYFPAQAAVRSQVSLVSSPVKDNLGYLVIQVSRNEIEGNMPDFLEGNVTATIDYDIENAFGIGNTNFYINEMSDEEWLRSYQQYGFWNGKGFVRADSIQNDGATISIYRDANAKQATVQLKKGEMSKDVYLGGFYCAAGLNLQLTSLEAPVTSALLQINDQQIWVSRGDRILKSSCSVTDIQTYGGGGKISLSCPVQNGKIDLSLNPGKVTFTKDGNQIEKTIGDKVIDNGDSSVYLGYVGQDAGSKKFAVLIQDPYSYNEYSFADKEIFSAVEKILRTNKKIEDLKSSIKNEIISQYRRKVSYSGGRIDDSRIKIEIATESESAFGFTLKEVSIGKDRTWDLTKSDEKLAKEYYEEAIRKYEDLAGIYPNEKMPGSEDPYAAAALYNAAELSRKLGMNEKAQEYYNRLIKDYPNSNVVRQVERNRELIMRYDSYSSKAIVNINNEQYFIDVLDFRKPTINDVSAVLLINGKPETLGLNDFKILDNKKGVIQLTEVKEDYVSVSFSQSPGSFSYSDFFFNRNYNSNSNMIGGSIRRINLHEQVALNDIVVNLAEIKLNKQVKIQIIPKAFGPRGESSFKFKIGIEKRGINLSVEQTKSLMKSIDDNLEQWNEVNDKLGKVVTGLKGACFATSAVLMAKTLISGFSGEAIARRELMTGANGWNEFCQKLVSDKTASKYTNNVYDSVQNCLLSHSTYINKDVTTYANQIKDTNDLLKSMQGEVTKSDVLDLQGQVDQKQLEERFKQRFKQECQDMNGNIILPDRDSTAVSINDVCSWSTLSYEQRRDVLTLVNARNSGGSDVLKNMIDSQLGKTVLEAKNFHDYQGARIRAEEEANKLNLGVGLLSPAGDNVVYGPVKRVTKADLSNPAYANYKEGDSVVRVFVPVSQNFGGKESFVADSSVAGKEVIVKVKTDAFSKDFVPDINASVYTVNGNSLSEKGLSDVRRYMSEAKINRIRELNERAYQNRIIKSEDLKVEYFERAPYKGLPAFVPFDVENGWYVQMEYVLAGFGKPYDESGRAVNYYICNVGPNGIPEFKKSNDDICRYYNGVNSDLGFQGMSGSESVRLVQAAQRAIMDAAKQYGKKQVLVNGRKFASAINFGGEEGRCSDFMSPEDCHIMFNVCDPVICPSSRCDLGGRFRVDNVMASGIIGSLTLCLPNIREGILIPVCLTGVHAGIESYLSILNSTRQCLNESLETGRNVGICDEIKSIYICEFFWKQTAPFVNAIIPRLIEMMFSQGVRGGGEYLTVQSAWDNTQAAVNYFTNDYAVNSMNAFRLRSVEDAGSEVCKSYTSITYPSSSVIDRLLEPDSPVQYSAWFSEDSLTTATIPPTSHYKVYYHIYSGKDYGSYYSVYLKDLPTSNYVFVAGSYIVDNGYIARGSQIDQAKDFTAVSGYKQLCVNVNGQEKCDFGKVSTSYLLNSISDAYAVQQAKQNIVSQSACVAGTASLYSLVQPNLQAGVEDVLSPNLYNQGIVRVCASQNPGKQVLANGQFDNAKNIYDRWKDVGYCDDPTIRCWLDTSSVQDVIKDTGLEKSVLQNIDFNTFGVSGFLTDESSREIAAKAEKSIKDLDFFEFNGQTRQSIDARISSITNDLNQLVNLGTNNVHRARGLYLFGNLFSKISGKLFGYAKVGVVGAAPLPAGSSSSGSSSTSSGQSSTSTGTSSSTTSSGTASESPSDADYAIKTAIRKDFGDSMLTKDIDMHVYYTGVSKTLNNGKKDFVVVYSSRSNGWKAGDEGFNSALKGLSYVDGVIYLSSKMGIWDSIVVNGNTFYYGMTDGNYNSVARKVLNALGSETTKTTTPSLVDTVTSNGYGLKEIPTNGHLMIYYNGKYTDYNLLKTGVGEYSIMFEVPEEDIADTVGTITYGKIEFYNKGQLPSDLQELDNYDFIESSMTFVPSG